MGNETRKCFDRRLRRGDFQNFLKGRGLDIGAGSDPLTAPDAIVDAWDLPQGDAQHLEGVADESYDFVYSSHCLEHMRSVEQTLRNWCRILKPGGFLYLVVPDFTLYEKEHFPSKFNSDHKQTFSLYVPRGAVGRDSHWNVKSDIPSLLESYGVRVTDCFVEDENYDYKLPDHVDQTHFPQTLAQICIVARKRLLSENVDTTEFITKVGVVSEEPFRIYTGILGQIGDIVMFTATARRIKQLFPNSRITFAVSRKYAEAGELIAGLPYIERVFIADAYFDHLRDSLVTPWREGWPVDLRGEDEANEQRLHDLIFETRPRYPRMPWWRFAHQVEESAYRIGVPIPRDLQTDIKIPDGVSAPQETIGKIVIHNDPAIDGRKAWNWNSLRTFVHSVGPKNVVLLGNEGPEVPGIVDYRSKTTLAQAAAIIASCQCYVGIDSGLMWIAASLKVPVVGIYGTAYIPAYGAIHPKNDHARYIQVEGALDSVSAELVLENVKICLKNRLALTQSQR